MLKKLIKYDFKWINKIMYIYFTILFIITLLIKIINCIEQTFLIMIFNKIAVGIFISCCISVAITCLMRIWTRFVQNVYKDESYLTHTLPVTKKQILNAKIISSIMSIVLSFFIIISCVAIVYLDDTTIQMIKNMYQSLINAYNSTFALLFVLGLIVLVLLEIICMMMAGIFGIVMGHRFNNGKLIKSIIIGFGSYILYNNLSLIIVLTLGNVLNFEIIADVFPTLSSITIIGLTFITVFTAYNLLYYYLSRHFFNKGVNVD